MCTRTLSASLFAGIISVLVRQQHFSVSFVQHDLLCSSSVPPRPLPPPPPHLESKESPTAPLSSCCVPSILHFSGLIITGQVVGDVVAQGEVHPHGAHRKHRHLRRDFQVTKKSFCRRRWGLEISLSFVSPYLLGRFIMCCGGIDFEDDIAPPKSEKWEKLKPGTHSRRSTSKKKEGVAQASVGGGLLHCLQALPTGPSRCWTTRVAGCWRSR